MVTWLIVGMQKVVLMAMVVLVLPGWLVTSETVAESCATTEVVVLKMVVVMVLPGLMTTSETVVESCSTTEVVATASYNSIIHQSSGGPGQ